MNEEKAKIIHLYRVLGSDLEQSAQWIQKRAFNIKPVRLEKSIIRSLVRTHYPNVGLELNDRYYYVEKWAVLKNIIKYDWTNKKKYVTDRYDCDNFADTFNARMAQIYGLNTSGRFSVAIYSKDTDELINYHRASLIVCYENAILSLYAYDPMEKMEDGYCKVEKDKPVIIRYWKYIPNKIEFN